MSHQPEQIPQLPAPRAEAWGNSEDPKFDAYDAHQMISMFNQGIASVKREPLSDEQIDQIHGHAYIALRAQGFSGGMGGLTWDRASARAIEQAHGIGATVKDSLTADSGESNG